MLKFNSSQLTQKKKQEDGLASMFGKLRVGQNLFAKLESISVLLVLVASLQDIKQKNNAQQKHFVLGKYGYVVCNAVLEHTTPETTQNVGDRHTKNGFCSDAIDEPFWLLE